MISVTVMKRKVAAVVSVSTGWKNGEAHLSSQTKAVSDGPQMGGYSLTNREENAKI